MVKNAEQSTQSRPALGNIKYDAAFPATSVELQGWQMIVLRKPLGQAAEKAEKWNTDNLGRRLFGDTTSAAAAGVLVAPLITMVDRGIIENASNRCTLGESVRSSFYKLLFRPHSFFFSRPFALVFSLYFGTYLTANTVDTFASTVKNKPASHVTAGTSKFLLTSSANLSLCLAKDARFTKLFGAAKSARALPPASYALFAARDCCTIFASFNLPRLLAPNLPIGDEVERFITRASIAQFLTPAAMQVFSTPLHLLGLDLYNRNGSTTMQMRMQKVSQDWSKSVLARMGRVGLAFGVGGVVNTRVRKAIMTKLE